MCRRYALPEQSAAEREFTPGHVWWKFKRRFNVSVTQYVPAIRVHQGQSEAVMMRWGLIPSWAEGKPPEAPPACIGVEQLEGSMWSRSAWECGQRCILPLTGFYAWQLTRGRYRQPYFVGLMDRSVFGLAAIWDRSVADADDDVIESCSMVCVPANELMGRIASGERSMPAILKRRDYDTWLRGSSAEAAATLQAYGTDRMRAHPVSPRINSRAVDDPGLIKPVRALC
jgi:putative SOS response-associated peptidase YedK